MTDINTIKELLDRNKIDEAIQCLSERVQYFHDDDNAFFMLGNAYRRLNDWKNAMSCYCKAIDINPNSPAKDAYKAAEDILNFYNHDLYNP